MKHTIFFSWQSDTPPITGRNFLERALDRAVGAVGQDAEVEEAIRKELEVDRDTKGLSGSPPIVESIFKKIDKAAVFVADLTFAGRRLDGAPTPNPNVLIEYGWALKSLGHGRIISVMNTAFGNPTDDEMPFDLRHLRHPFQYHCPSDADEETRLKARAALAKQLEGAIRSVVDSDDFRATLPKPAAPPPFPRKEPLNGLGQFRAKGQPLGISDDTFPIATPRDIHLEDGPALWLRVMPNRDPGRSWTEHQIRRAATVSNAHILPMGQGTGSWGYARAADGFAIRGTLADKPGLTAWAVIVFDTGEVWTVDTFLLAATGRQTPPLLPLDEEGFARALEDYSKLLSRLGVQPPYIWIAGMEGIRGRTLHVPPRAGKMASPLSRGTCLVDDVVVEGFHSLGVASKQSLRPFFEKVYARCGLERPFWLND